LGSSIYRIESYGSLGNPNKEDKINYCTRMIENPTYKQDLAKLMNYEPGPDRISYWNQLFSCDETCDTDFAMDMSILKAPNQ
jgi:uncharacterized protein YllA (UPF0747 family)